MILVTGASGLLGVALVTQACDAGREVAGICHQHVLQIPGAPMHCLDLRDGEAAGRLLERLRPRSVIHCAAATNVDWCEKFPAEAEVLNVAASRALAEAAARVNAKFLYISTDSVFDGSRGEYREDDSALPVNAYARSKLRAEQEVKRAHPDATVARVTIYGWNAQPKCSLAEWILAGLRNGKPVPGFTDVHFSPILANDLAEVLLAMLDCNMSGIYHVVGAERCSKYEFARSLAAEFGLDQNLVKPTLLREARMPAPRPLDISLDTAKISQALGRKMPNVTAGLRKFRTLEEQGYPQRIKACLLGAAL
jgi:dTDP-4-dehydrorhamnose reductase